MCTNSNIVIKYDYNFKLNKTMGFFMAANGSGIKWFCVSSKMGGLIVIF